jgi:hypothetical protein
MNRSIKHSSPETVLQETLAEAPVDCAIPKAALLDFLRASRRAKLAEVAALERFEQALTTQRASRPSEK